MKSIQLLFYKIRGAFNEIPKPILNFALKGLLIFIIWESLYNIFLVPNRVIDKPLTELVGSLSASGLKFIFIKEEFSIKNTLTIENEDLYIKNEIVNIFKGKKKLIGIADSCNGLNLYILFLGFIIAFPSKLKKKIIFGIAGIIMVFSTNVLRCIGLGIIQIQYPHFMFYAHHYVFKIITYAVVFFLWSQFSKSK